MWSEGRGGRRENYYPGFWVISDNLTICSHVHEFPISHGKGLSPGNYVINCPGVGVDHHVVVITEKEKKKKKKEKKEKKEKEKS